MGSPHWMLRIVGTTADRLLPSAKWATCIQNTAWFSKVPDKMVSIFAQPSLLFTAQSH